MYKFSVNVYIKCTKLEFIIHGLVFANNKENKLVFNLPVVVDDRIGEDLR